MIRIFVFTLSALLCFLATGTLYADSWGDKRPVFKPEVTAKPSAKPKANQKPARNQPTAINGGSPLEKNDILIGLKGGFQFNHFTDVTVDGRSQTPTNGTGYLFGGVFYWNLGLPRLEIDVLANSRKSGQRDIVPYIGVPILVKFNVAENRRLTWQAGAGVQTDVAIGGGSTRRGVLIGLPVATDLLIDLADSGVFLNLELRYIFGMLTYDGGTTGGRPRDLDLAVGLMLPIDRQGF